MQIASEWIVCFHVCPAVPFLIDWLIDVLFFLSSALGLKCYDCLSTKSWDDCKGTSKDCIGGADRCAKVYFKAASSKIFAKYCTLSALCSKEKNPTCKNAIGSFECDISCCDGDNCNAGSTSRISGILLLTCALASLMILVKAWHWSQFSAELQFSF